MNTRNFYLFVCSLVVSLNCNLVQAKEKSAKKCERLMSTAQSIKPGTGYFEVEGDLYQPHGQVGIKGGLEGQKLYYEYYPAKTKNKKPLTTFLLLPPLAGDVETWRPVIQLLIDQGYGVLAVDPPVHGKSLVKMMEERDVLLDKYITAFTKAEAIKSLIKGANIENLQIVAYAHSGPEVYLIGSDPEFENKIEAVQMLNPYLERIDQKLGRQGREAISAVHDVAGVFATMAVGWFAPGLVMAAWADRENKINAVSEFAAMTNLGRAIRSYATFEANRTGRHFTEKYLDMLAEKVSASIINNVDITFIGHGRRNYDALTGRTKPFDYVGPKLLHSTHLILGENDTMIPSGYYEDFMQRLDQEKVPYERTVVPYKTPRFEFPAHWSAGHFTSVINPEGLAKAMIEFKP